jgi:hypothetical protein
MFYTKKVTKLPDLAVVHWTSETWCEYCRLSTGLSPVDDYVSYEPEGGAAASMKPGQKSCVRSSGIITLSA